MKNKKKLRGFSYTWNIANFESFRWNISLSTNLFFSFWNVIIFENLAYCGVWHGVRKSFREGVELEISQNETLEQICNSGHGINFFCITFSFGKILHNIHEALENVINIVGKTLGIFSNSLPSLSYCLCKIILMSLWNWMRTL